MSKARREGRASGRSSVSLAMSSGLVLLVLALCYPSQGQKGFANLSQEWLFHDFNRAGILKRSCFHDLVCEDCFIKSVCTTVD